MRVFLIVLIFILAISCAKEDEFIELAEFSEQRFIGKVLPDSEGYWLITRTIQNRNCSYCSSLDFIDGLAYFSNQKTSSKDAIGYFLDAELKSDNLLTVTTTQILSFDKSLQNSVIRTAGINEAYKLMVKDATGKIWVLSNKSIFNLEGESFSFPNNIPAMDFEVDKDNSFWISSSDTIYQYKYSQLKKFALSKISGTRNNISSIYSLKIDKNDSIWVNTSQNIFKFNESGWIETNAGSFVSDNFKTVPFMDVDSKGNLWLAEKNYKAFTTLHRFDGKEWLSYKLEPSFESWITDIEIAEPGSIWIGTVNGLRKLNLR